MVRPSGSGANARISLIALALLTAAQVCGAVSISSLVSRRAIARDGRQVKRDSSQTQAAAISIGASQYWEGDDGPWSSFPIQVGSGSVAGDQTVRVFPSTAGTAIWTIGADGCPAGYVANCANSRGDLFLPNQSLTWSPNSVYQTGLEKNLDMDSSGPTGYDTVTLGWQGSGGPTDAHATIWNLDDSNYWLGIFGLNPRPTNFTTQTDPQPSFMQTIYDNFSIPSLSYGYTAGNQYRLNAVFGSLTLGGYDANRFVPNDVTFQFYEDISRDLTVYIQGIKTDKGTPSNLLPDGTISIFIDSTVSELWLPESACTAFEQAFGIEYSDTYSHYILNNSQRQTLLNTNAQVTFTLSPNETGGDTVDIVLPYGAFDLQVDYPIIENAQNKSYYFPLQRATNDTQYTLGRTFLQEAYLIADYERGNFSVSQCDWTQANVQTQHLVNIVSTNSTHSGHGSSSSGFPVGGIVGVVVGVVALIAILGLILFLLRRKKNANKQRLAELEAKETEGAAKSSDVESSKPFISHPMGGELGGAEVHELGAPYKQAPQEMDSPYKMDPNKAGYSEMEGQEYFGPGKHFASEMQGSTPIFEMQGSDVHEMPTPERRPSK